MMADTTRAEPSSLTFVSCQQSSYSRQPQEINKVSPSIDTICTPRAQGANHPLKNLARRRQLLRHIHSVPLLEEPLPRQHRIQVGRYEQTSDLGRLFHQEGGLLFDTGPSFKSGSPATPSAVSNDRDIHRWIHA